NQCGKPRAWQETEITLLYQTITELVLNLQPTEFQAQLEQQAEQEEAIEKVIRKIQRTNDIKQIFQTATQEIRKLLKADRSVVYRFYEDWSGEVVAESVGSGWVSLIQEQDKDPSIRNDLMSSDQCTVKRMDSPPNLDSDTYFKETKGGIYNQGIHYRQVDDIYAMEFSTCYLESLEKFQCKAYINIPIFQAGKLWGLFCVYQNSGPRKWQDWETRMLVRFSVPLGTALNQLEIQDKLKEKSQQIKKIVDREETLNKIISRIRQSSDYTEIFTTVTQDLREILNCDRAVVYCFYEDWSGEVIAESVGPGWVSLIEEQNKDLSIRNDLMSSDRCTIKQLTSPKNADSDTYLKETQGGIYNQGERYRKVDDIYQAGFSRCYLDSLEKFQCKAYINVPIFTQNRLWGLLCVYQNDAPRQWQKEEVELMARLSNPLGLVLKQANLVEQIKIESEKTVRAAERDKALARITDSLRDTFNLNSIFRIATQEIRQFLNADRSVVYRFYEDWSGEVVAESVGSGWVSLIEQQEKDSSIKTDLMSSDRCTIKQIGTPPNLDSDTYLKETQGGTYSQGERYRKIDDIYQAGFSRCYLDSLEKFQCKAYINVPIFQKNKLWGLLCVYQNDTPRNWTSEEVDFMVSLSSPLGVALQQAEFVNQIQAESEKVSKAAERERAIAKINDKIRESLDLETIFSIATQELRQLLNADRSVIYRFYPDWSGEVVAESVASGWISLMKQQEKDSSIKTDLMSSDRCTVKQIGTPPNLDTDTYLKDTKGGMYVEGDTYRQVDDIYAMEFSACYISSLEKFQARAYINVPIFQGSQLWGLLCVYQNDAPRKWQKSDVSVLQQISGPLSVAIEQAESLVQLQKQSSKLERQTKRQEILARVTSRLFRALDLDQVFRIATQDVRNMLAADRIALYQFDENWGGKFVAESAATGWNRVIDVVPVIDDSHLQDTKGGRYKDNDYIVVEDIYTIGHSSCHIELLEQMQARAYTIVPVFVNDKLWGLLGAYDNTGPRQWEDAEVDALKQVGVQIGAAIRQLDYIQQARQQSQQLTKLAERETNFIRLIYKIGQRIIERLQQKTLNPETLFRSITQELRQLLKVDRVAIYRFNPDWSGEFIIEDVGSGFLRLAGTQAAHVEDPTLQETRGGKYRQKETSAVNDINEAAELTFDRDLLEQWGVRAYTIAPLFQGEQLWGLLITYNNTYPRQWEEGEVNLLVQIATQLGIILQQAEYLEQLQSQSQQLEAAAEREKAAKEQLQQRAVQMLEAVKPAFQGDLTVRAPLSDDQVGTIAEAYNNTLQSLREIVMQVQTAAAKVGETSLKNTESITELSQQSQHEVKEVTQALDRIKAMGETTQAVATNAQQVEVAVKKANETVREGDTAMNRTVDSILAIRETVSETSKKIKRLSESSQKISKVVSLIGNFTTQTQLLSLNAAIEATRAGEYGRGFAVVADEVRSLARQSAEATKEIEKLVQEIQTETSAVSAAMETGIEQVVGGTNRVNEARQNLNAIVAATDEIGELIAGISQATLAQTEQSEAVTKTMTDLAEIANKTSADSVEISMSFQELLATARELQDSVGQFKVS
nr:GAF domain-containing protein [Prochloraceae cyanobacterium]